MKNFQNKSQKFVPTQVHFRMEYLLVKQFELIIFRRHSIQHKAYAGNVTESGNARKKKLVESHLSTSPHGNNHLSSLASVKLNT